jgi:hypothetical protein
VLDGDPDLEEPGDLEPTMGAPEGRQSPHDWAWTPLDEAEHDDGDAELGWSNEGSQKRLHADGSGLDREPSLGANGGSNGSDHLSGWRMPTPARRDEAEDGGDDEPYLAGHPPHGDYAIDAEEENEHNEPSLGSLDRQPQTLSYRLGNTFAVDPEGDGDGREADLEPSLGAPEAAYSNQSEMSATHFGVFGSVSRGGRIVTVINGLDQTFWAKGGTDDRELDPAEEGEPEEYAH